MVRPPRKPVSGSKEPDTQSSRPARRSRFDLKHALDPVASVLRSALLSRSADRDEPGRSKVASHVKMPQRSPLAPTDPPDLPPVAGVALATADTGIKYKDRPDFLVAAFRPGTASAGVFTQSAAAAAPVLWCQDALERPGGREGRLLLVNAGNANAFTGKAGMETVKTVVRAAAETAKCRQRTILVASTGVIGEPLDPAPLTDALPDLLADLTPEQPAGPIGWAAAARAIMTTDTFPKVATAQTEIDGVPVRINGIAKGSGMIAPDMATMLAFLVTDAALPPDVLQTLLLLGTRDTFNTITVDSDTSTNDTVLAYATHAAAHAPVTRAGDRRLADFRRKWHGVMHDLALQIVRDGEGATKLVRIAVTGAETARGARAIARAIADSPLVKTAIAGEDANWGRIVMAVGKAGVAVDMDRVAIRIGGHRVAAHGQRDSAYHEAALARHMKESEIGIEVDVGSGAGTAVVWTCDLTHGYIAINADYRS